jgi:4,4'-diaponeurosporenoate glycosyltransferase
LDTPLGGWIPVLDWLIAVELAAWFPLTLLLMWQVLFPRRVARLAHPPTDQPRISVVIPARNEGHQIGRLLRSLHGQTLSLHQIVVVDDDSTDDTASVASACGATVLQAGAAPPGWNGKTWACWRGASACSGDVLLFLDADTWLEPHGVHRLVGLYGGAGLLTVQPYHVTQRAYEQLSAFFNLVIVAALGAFTPLGERIEPGGSFGPCVMCARDDYLRVGGHREVRSEVIEDIPLAKLFLRHGLPVRCYLGRGIISFRMYPGGLRELIAGWTKGMGYGAVSVNPLFSLLSGAWITGCFTASVALVRAMAGLGTPAGWAALLGYLLCALLVGRCLAGVGDFRWWTSALFPIPLCFFAGVVARSLVLTYVFRRVTWKGRAIQPARRGF